jgi:hypothetical protein
MQIICLLLRFKTWLLTIGFCLTSTQSVAQLFSPRATEGAVLGGLAGGIIGHNSGRRTGEGIAIGAGVGLLLGSIADREAARRSPVWHTQPVVHSVVHYQQAAPPPETQPTPEPPPSRIFAAGSAINEATPLSQANGLFGR